MRTTIRRRLGMYGVCAVLSGGCLAFLVVIAMDWLLELPALLRVFAAGLFVVGFGLATLHWIVRPLQTRLTLAQVAGRLERHFDGLDDRLSSTVSFLTRGGMGGVAQEVSLVTHGGEGAPAGQMSAVTEDATHEEWRDGTHEGRYGIREGRHGLGSGGAGRDEMSAALMAQVIVNTDRVVAELPLDRILTRRPLMRQLGLLLAGLTALATISLTAGDWVAIGVRRYLRPFGETRWPHRVEIVPISGDFKVPIGESATVRMRVTRGWNEDLRGVLHLRDDEGRHTVMAMHGEGADGYRCTIDGVSGDLSYWFESGDDATEGAPLRITSIRRVGVRSIFARIDPPPYAHRAEAAEYDLSAGPASAVPGSLARVTLDVTKRLDRGDDGRARAWLDWIGENQESGRIPLQFAEGDLRRLACEFRVESSLKIAVHLVDRDGFRNQTGLSYTILTRPDDVPRVELIEPRALTEVSPSGSVMIRARAEDDFGLTDLRLMGRIDGSDAVIATPLLDHAELSSFASRVSASLNYLWEIKPLELTPPATVVYRVQATDNCAFRASGGQTGSSRTMRLRIISPSELESRIQEEFVLLQKRLRQALQFQQAITDEMVEVEEEEVRAATYAGVGGAGDKGWRDGRGSRVSDRAMHLAGRENTGVRDVAALSSRFVRLAVRVELNGVQSAASSDVLRAAGARLTSVAQTAMTDVTQQLGRVVEIGLGDEGRAALKEAIARGHAAADELRALIRQMDQWGEFQDLIGKTRDLADRQQRLRRRTRELSGRTLGKRTDELSPSQRSDLRQLERMQRQVADELGGLLNRLRAAVGSHAAQDPAGAATMRAALRAAATDEVGERMHRAADAVRDNRLAGAGVEQRLAERGLSKMLVGLEKREVRRLAELVKRLERADIAAAELLADQKALLEATREASSVEADATVFVGQSADQARLERNATGLSRAWGTSDETAEAGRLVRRSARMMGRATSSLSEGNGRGAVKPQESAVDNLRDAVALLEARVRRAAHAASQRMMAAVRARLEDMRTGQAAIHEGTRAALDVVVARGRLNRSTARKVAKLSNAQEEVRATAEAVGRQVARTVVYARVVRTIMDDMESSRDALAARRVATELVDTQAEIIRRLDQLIRALRDAAALPPSDEFVESGGAGGGGSDDGERVAIPTAAELLMLKTMQVELLTDTLNLDARRPDDGLPSETDFREAELLGERQREVRELTQEVVREAAGGS